MKAHKEVRLKDFSLCDLADLCQCNAGCLSRYLRGRKELPKIESRLAIVLGLTVSALRARLGLPARRRTHSRTMTSLAEYQYRRWVRGRVRARAAGAEPILWANTTGRECFYNRGKQTLACPRGREAIAEASRIENSEIRESWNGELKIYRGRRLIQRCK